jgi:hypothetical protein
MTNKPGRNEPCYCGSGKKYKRCHLPIDEKALAAAAPSQKEIAGEPSQPFGEEVMPKESPSPADPKNIKDVVKLLTRSGLMKRDPELCRLFKENETLLTYVANEQEIEAAYAKLKPHAEEFRQFFHDNDAVTRRTEELFSEESFAPLRFTVAEVEKAFQKVGSPPETGDSEDFQQISNAILFLASKERRDHLAMELLTRLPGYVEQGRFIDAGLIDLAAAETLEAQDQVNPFLVRMFSYGFDDLARQQQESKEAILGELGLHSVTDMAPDEIDAWLAEIAADPAKTAQVERWLDAHPEVFEQSTATPGGLYREAVRLFERKDAARLLLRPEEMEPWMPLVTQKLQLLSEKYGLVEGGALIPEAQQQEAFSTITLPMMQEVAKGIFTPERIRKLVADLKAYRKELFAAGEKAAAFSASNAILYVEREDDPSQNGFLVTLCARSIDFGAKEKPPERP